MTRRHDDKPSLLAFPTGSSVPFPYPTPYPQQTALMDTLLQCLRQKDDQDEADKATPEEQDSNSSTASTKTKKRQRAAVMMLESPTGTGYVAIYEHEPHVISVFL